MLHFSKRMIGTFAAALIIVGCTPTDTELSASQKASAEAYIRSNIASISPRSPVLGGTFFVTDIRWENDTAIVDYEDGHIAFRAEMNVEVDADGEVSVSDIELEENPPPASYSSSSTSSDASSTAGRPRAKLGELCGGIAGFMCEEGLECDYEGRTFPDAAGTCKEGKDEKKSSVEIEQQFEGKVVYGYSSDEDQEAMKEDCRKRNGTFNECGSPCAPDAEACIQVCAFTCTYSSN